MGIMGELPSLRTREGNIIHIGGGSRDVLFPNSPNIPEDYRGKVVRVEFENSYQGVKIYRSDTKWELTGQLKKIVIDDILKHPL